MLLVDAVCGSCGVYQDYGVNPAPTLHPFVVVTKISHFHTRYLNIYLERDPSDDTPPNIH